MTGPTFRTYVMKHARLTDSAAGDFIKDSRMLIECDQHLAEDKRFPTTNTWAALRSAMRLRGADAVVVAAGRIVWRRYTAWRRSQAAT